MIKIKQSTRLSNLIMLLIVMILVVSCEMFFVLLEELIYIKIIHIRLCSRVGVHSC
jgi:hypothetical protein